MTLVKDIAKARAIARRLPALFETEGIHGHKGMPEDEPPAGIERGSLEHLLFITLTVSIDYQRDAVALWQAARDSWEYPGTRWVFEPSLVHARSRELQSALQVYKLSKKPVQDAGIWRTVAVSFFKKWDGDPRAFLSDCGMDAPTVLQRLHTDTHPPHGHLDYPFLRGKKIGPLWVRMLRDQVGIELKRLEEVPIPVDIHIARATFATGVVRGCYQGDLEPVFEVIRKVWKEAVSGLSWGGRPMVAGDIDEALWHLSKYGCTHRNKHGWCPQTAACPVRKECVPGRVRLNLRHSIVELETDRRSSKLE